MRFEELLNKQVISRHWRAAKKAEYPDHLLFSNWTEKLPRHSKIRPYLRWRALANSLPLVVVPALCWVLVLSFFGGLNLWVGGFLSLFAILLWRDLYSRQAPEAIRELMDFPSNEQFPVMVKVFGGSWNSRCLIGSDLGVITFTEDVLHFEGSQTSFDLPSRWVMHEPLLGWGKRAIAPEIKAPYPLFWYVKSKSGKIEVDVFKRVKGSQIEYQSEFRKALYEWMIAEPVSHNTLNLPPVSKTISLNGNP